MKKLSIIIAAYNEERSILSVLSGIRQVMRGINIPHEIIVINDGSTDNTKDLVEKKGVILINHPYKKGYGASLKDGVKRALGDFVLFIDADGQHDPKYIVELIKHTDEYDMVVGARTNVNSIPRAIAKIFISSFANYLVEHKIPDLNSGLRIVKKDVITEYLHLLPDSFSLSSTITIAVLKGGHNLKYVSIKEGRRKSGKSTIHPLKDFVRFIVLILRLTIVFSPLRVFLPISLGLFLVGLLYTIFNVIKFFDVPDSGIFLILSSIIIFFFGLLADQIAYIRRKIK
ncbi:MAG: glycosyltransferase family 2 protein [Patescibacteria group bacterium]|nr:glycosyltransferase family 2 protein [Patescibacteria group bacterium]